MYGSRTSMTDVKPSAASIFINEASVNQKLVSLSRDAHSFLSRSLADSFASCSP